MHLNFNLLHYISEHWCSGIKCPAILLQESEFEIFKLQLCPSCSCSKVPFHPSDDGFTWNVNAPSVPLFTCCWYTAGLGFRFCTHIHYCIMTAFIVTISAFCFQSSSAWMIFSKAGQITRCQRSSDKNSQIQIVQAYIYPDKTSKEAWRVKTQYHHQPRCSFSKAGQIIRL